MAPLLLQSGILMARRRAIITGALLMALIATALLFVSSREQSPPSLEQAAAARVADVAAAPAESDEMSYEVSERATTPDQPAPLDESTAAAPESRLVNKAQRDDSYFVHPANHDLFDYYGEKAQSSEWGVSASAYRTQLFLAIAIIGEFEQGAEPLQRDVQISLKPASDRERVFALNGRVIRFDIDEYSEFAEFEAYVAESRSNPPGRPVPLEIAGAIQRRVDYARAILGPRAE